MWLTMLSWKWFTKYKKVLFKGPWASSNKNFKSMLNVKYDIVALNIRLSNIQKTIRNWDVWKKNKTLAHILQEHDPQYEDYSIGTIPWKITWLIEGVKIDIVIFVFNFN